MQVVHSGHLRSNAIDRRASLKQAQDRKHKKVAGLIRSSRIAKYLKRYRVLKMIFLLLLLGGFTYSGIVRYRNYRNEKAADELIAQSEPLDEQQREDNGAGDGTKSEDAKITKKGVIIPSTDRPTYAEIMAYKAPADYPKRIKINGQLLGMVTTVDDTEFGEVGVPANVYNAAWYVKSSKIGSRPGSSILVGHTGFRSIEGIFRHIDKLKTGDTITIVMGNDQEFSYRIIGSESVEVKDFKMSKYLSYNNGKSLLHLITCNGSVASGGNQYSSRFVVSAELI